MTLTHIPMSDPPSEPPLFSHILHFTPCGAAEACRNLLVLPCIACCILTASSGYDMQYSPTALIPRSQPPNSWKVEASQCSNKLTNQSLHSWGGLTTPRGQDMPPAHWYLNTLQYKGASAVCTGLLLILLHALPTKVQVLS